MAKARTIGAVAKAEGVPASTLRYYERMGLLKPSQRTGANYRLYDADAVERLRFIRAAQAIGFTLEDTARLLAYQEGHREPCAEVQELLEARLGELDQRLADLRRVRRQVKASLARCHESEDSGRCQVMNRLRAESRTRR